MKVLMLAPAIPPSPRGNARSVARILPGLRRTGANIDVGELAHASTLLGLHAQVDLFHLFHLFHLTQSFEAVQANGGLRGRPYVLTQTGTDMWPQPLRTPEFLQFLCASSSITVYHEQARALLLQQYPELLPSQVKTVLKSVDLPPNAAPLPERVEAFIRDSLVLFLPAHLRPVKGIEYALAAFDKLRARLTSDQTPVVLLIAGEILDAAYAESLALGAQPGVMHVSFNRSEMVSAYARATVVLNTSLIESCPNALLEALYLGRPVIARNIPGVRGLAQIAAEHMTAESLEGLSSPIAFFGEDPEYPSLDTLLARCLADRTRLAEMAVNAKRAFAYLRDSEREGRAYRALYDEALASASRVSAS